MMKTASFAGLLFLWCVRVYGNANDPSNFFYRVSPADAPLKLEAVFYAPRPNYPSIARKQHLEGSGVAEIRIKPDGSVQSVRMLQTTGQKALDEAAIEGFGRWRFRPRGISLVRIPIQFRMALSSVQWGSRKDLKNVGDGDIVVIVAGPS
jgi:TonB family protein